MKRVCPRCQHEVIDDFQLMAEHLEQCNVNCKSCVDMKTNCLKEPCRQCSGYQKWRNKAEGTFADGIKESRGE